MTQVEEHFRYMDLWYNLPVEQSELPVDSERWHRDHEDRKIVKLYLYLVDVEEQMGPFTYIRSSQPGGKRRKALPSPSWQYL